MFAWHVKFFAARPDLQTCYKTSILFVYSLEHLFYSLFGTRDLFNISYSRELYLFSKFLHFEEIVRVKMAVCFEMIVIET